MPKVDKIEQLEADLLEILDAHEKRMVLMTQEICSLEDKVEELRESVYG